MSADTVRARALLFDRFARWGNCGPQWDVPCEGGRGALALGPVVLIGGLLMLGRIADIAGWSGPVLPFGGFSLLYGSTGAAWTLGSGALSGGHGAVGALGRVVFALTA